MRKYPIYTPQNLPANFFENFTMNEKEKKIAISPHDGNAIYMLARLSNAKNILEIGSLRGYSSVWLASALPQNGSLVCIEHNNLHAKSTSENLDAANLQCKTMVINQSGHTIPSEIINQKFDIIFVDADKVFYPKYFEIYKSLLTDVGFMIFDNIFFHNLTYTSQDIDRNTQLDIPVRYKKIVSQIELLITNVKNEGYSFSILPSSDGMLLVQQR